MPVPLSHPGVFVQEVPSGVRTIAGVTTATTLFVGWAPRGPVDLAERCTSFGGFARVYGGLDGRSLLGYAVAQFFANGGAEAWVLRIASGAAVATSNVGGLTVQAASPGAWAADYAIRTTRAAGDPTRFMLEVIRPALNNAVVESFPSLSMAATEARYAPTVVDGRSEIIDGLVATGKAAPVDATVPLGATIAGADGIVMDAGAAGFQAPLVAAFAKDGIIDQTEPVNLICVPGLTDAATVAALQAAARARRAFLIIDCGEQDTVATVPATLTGKTGADAGNSALYFPWVRAADPLRQGAVRAFPPCGFVAGVYARSDAARGVWKAPSETEARVIGSAGLSVAVGDADNGRLNPRGINCLRTLAPGTVIWGARTLDGDDQRGSDWRYVPVRRTALFIEESIRTGLGWAVFEPNAEPLWAQIRLTVGSFMQGLFRQGAFQGSTPAQAFFVKCDRATTTQADVDMGVVDLEVGFAPLKPAEFVTLRIRQRAGPQAA